MRLLLCLVVVYLLMVGIAYLTQQRLLYFPDPTPPSVHPIWLERGLALMAWPTAEIATFRGYTSLLKPRYSRGQGTVVVFHGNAGGARDRGYYLQALERRGYRVLLAEYPGYGGRRGGLGEADWVADSRETVRRALADFGGPLWVWGESLGAAVAAAVAADRSLPVAGVVLVTPWDSLTELAQSLYWYLPVRWLLRDRYDSIAYLSHYPGKIAVLIAGRDEIIPQRHSQRLYESLRGPKRRWIFPESGHNTWPIDVGAPWWDEVLRWLEATPATGMPDRRTAPFASDLKRTDGVDPIRFALVASPKPP